jgi:hypothetical protein
MLGLVAAAASITLPCDQECRRGVPLHPSWNRTLALAEMALTGSLHDEAGSCDPKRRSGCTTEVALPFSHERRWRGLDWPPIGHTMVGHLRLQNVRSALERVIHDRTPGDFVELGIWRGGVCVFASLVVQAYDSPRHVFGFDAFKNFGGYGKSSSYLAVSHTQVQHNFDKYGVHSSRYTLVPGYFNDTLPAFKSDAPIAVLRMDGNFYDAHVTAFKYMYRRVSVGGILIFDDYGHKGIKRFWKDFQRANKFDDHMHEIDGNGGWYMKASSAPLVWPV